MDRLRTMTKLPKDRRYSMSTVMKASEFVRRLKDVATNYKTLYVMGCFGAPLTAANKERYCNNHDYNKQASRTKMIQAASEDTFGFDCVCLIKGILWGWTGDKSKSYGGAQYKANGVPDIGADSMIKVCSDVTTDFSSIEVGEAVWCSGHIGIYVGDGLSVECTPAWKNRVQITAVGNIGSKSGYNTRKWTKHGKLPYIEYDVKGSTAPATSGSTTTVSGTASTGSSNDERTIWNFLFSKIGNAFGVAGLMGNLYAESALRSNNLQNSYESSLGYSDATYTSAVDKGEYTNFGSDAAGYGLAQWTYHTRKEGLLAYAKSRRKSIGDLTMQLEYLMKELSESYYGVLKTLKAATSVREASDAVLTKFERPADQSENAKSRRASYGQKYYDRYDGTSAPSLPEELRYNVGDIVQFGGGKHYVSANAATGSAVKASKAKVTAVCKGGKHPYHLRAVNASGKYISGVYGWVDASDISGGATVTAPAPTTSVKVDYAQKFDRGIAGKYKVTASSGLHIRAGAGAGKPSLGVLRCGDTVTNYGYYSIANGVKWLYVQTSSGAVGFCSSEWLDKC